MSSRPITDGDPLWYKDAIIYEVNLKGFRDSNRDGIGDFAGLTEKLDYIQDLGVTVIWLLPFYPSPLRDDGYDISDYRQVLPAYGTLADFKRFLRAAHDRGLRVLTELVIDHTSDQHPWFQAARAAPRGSSKRDWYVWSDTTDRYKDARIIFTDTERSNWAWDEVAKQYYWHRFFSHQPNLNFDNPAVVRAVQNVMEYWLDMGVDALRLDAIPYLFQREGTNCENLKEVHGVLKQLRAAVDRRYTERFFLAEANQWPSDVLEYFGNGDECHMAYHFPLMPRLYMAMARENRHAIVDIMKNTPAIPDVCQWAIFLRNHDELTLEMVTDDERDYMYREYARDPRMKCNVGIRRRLAPLLEFNRAAIELMNNMLFTLPGTPVIYYGDEIGMSDNIYLGDRNGVRTPMQWTLDRNAGFSEADPAQLYAPILADPLGGYPAVTVEAQQRSPSSLLHWMRKIISLRRRHAAFSRGSFQMLEPENHKVLAYVRHYRDETILVVSNLSRMVQPVQLDLSAWRGRVPVEMFGRTPLPPIGEQKYFLTLAPYGFYWLLLDVDESWRTLELRSPAAGRPPVLAPGVAAAQLFSGGALRKIEEALVRPWLEAQPWFAGEGRTVSSVRLIERIELAREHLWLAVVLVRFEDDQAASGSNAADDAGMGVERVGGSDAARPALRARPGQPHTYLLPLAMQAGEVTEPRALGMVECSDGLFTLVDAADDPRLTAALVEASAGANDFVGQDGRVQFRRTNVFDELSSNVRVKLFRRLESGVNPEIELAHHLTETVACSATPRAAGWAAYRRRDGSEFALALLNENVENEGDGWTWTAEYLGQLYEQALAGPRPAPGTPEMSTRVAELAGVYPDLAENLGRRTAELHAALAESSQSFAFFPEPLTAADRRRWFSSAMERARTLLDRLSGLERPELAGLIAQVLAGRKDVRSAYLRAKAAPVGGVKTRVHGDFHLGHVLVVAGDLRIVDFQGRTDRPLGRRREKELPLEDVASMRRSFQYVADAPLDRAAEGREKDAEFLRGVADTWLDQVGAAFLAGYQAASPEEERALQAITLRALELDRAFRELAHELAHRPAWVHVPLRGLARLLRRG